MQSAGGPGEEGEEAEEEEEEEELRNRGAEQVLMQLEHLARLCRRLQRFVLREVWMAAAPSSPTPAQREHVHVTCHGLRLHLYQLRGDVVVLHAGARMRHLQTRRGGLGV